MTTYTIIPYIYRDAGNWKQMGSINLEGEVTEAIVATLRAKLTGDDHFIPHDLKLDIEELQHQSMSFPDEELDHVFHELLLDEITIQKVKPEGPIIKLQDFVAAFERIKEWNVVDAMVRLEI